jgi:predicted enzyme related to lactoylglutathione lyase
MFENRPATAMIPAADLGRAIAWYEEKLGIKPAQRDDYGASFALNGVNAFLYKSDFAGTARHTLISFRSDDLKADMDEMGRRGVKFEEYDLPDLKTVNGIAEFGPVKNSWAKDSEGNIIGFVEGM